MLRKFPRSKERGSVEAVVVVVFIFSVQRFRVRKNAAPLKRCPRDCSEPRAPRFPRSKERGSVEALLLRTAAIFFREFPRSKERGSVEATGRP